MDYDDKNLDDPDCDIDRYDLPAGWQPDDPYQKARAEYRKRNAVRSCRQSLFETRAANKFMHGPAAAPPAELFGPMWRTGELAILAGEPGIGKSILAVQIAESIARTKSGKWKMESGSSNLPFSTLHFPLDVLYLDLERSQAQFKQRYTCPSPVPGKLPVKYRFSSKLRRAAFGELDIPDEFDGDFLRYFHHSLELLFDDEPAKVIIIDNLAALDPRGGPAATARRLGSLRLYAAETGTSILVLMSCEHKVKVPRPAAANSNVRNSSLFTIHSSLSACADSVFAIARSTFAHDIRYIKHLKGNYVTVENGKCKTESNPENFPLSTFSFPLSSDVHVFNLGRMENCKWQTVNNSEHLALTTDHLALSPAKPFLGFEYLGISTEESHLRNYAAEAL